MVANAVVPIIPSAPGRFSTTTVLPHRVARCWANTRAATSGELPGAMGTTIRTDRSGQSCAVAGAIDSVKAVKTTMKVAFDRIPTRRMADSFRCWHFGGGYVEFLFLRCD